MLYFRQNRQTLIIRYSFKRDVASKEEQHTVALEGHNDSIPGDLASLVPGQRHGRGQAARAAAARSHARAQRERHDALPAHQLSPAPQHARSATDIIIYV